MHLSIINLYAKYRDKFHKIVVLYNQNLEARMFSQLLLLLVTSSIFLIFAIKPTSVTVLNLTKEINEKQVTLKLMDEKITNLHQAQEVYSQQKDLITLVNLALPNEPLPEVFMGQLDVISRTNSAPLGGVAFSQIIIKHADDAIMSENLLAGLPPNAHGYAVTFNTTTSYDATKNFLSNLENLLRPLKIDSIIITKTQNDALTLTVKGEVPYY